MPKQAIGGYAELAICPLASCFEMPEDVPLPGAAALYFPFHLAWLGLVDRAGLQPGEGVLIHAAAGGAGSAAIQLAKHLGARVFATAGGEAKVALCRELGADVAIDYAREDFAAAVLQATGGAGADVVFDGVGEAVMEESMRCTAYGGRYLMMGFASDKRFADEKLIVPRRVATGNFKLCGVLLAYADAPGRAMMKNALGWNFCPTELGADITREIVALVRQKRIRPVIGEVVGFEEIPAALTRLRDRQTIGRTIATLG
jgi:NADPH2:quinone reductase